MQKGFKAVVKNLIRKEPGLTAREYARIALKRGLCGSDSSDPEWSLGTTLAKEYREGRMPGIRAERIDGGLRYFPADHPLSAERAADIRVQVSVPADVGHWVNVLIEAKQGWGPSEAITWLAQQGVKARRRDLESLQIATKAVRESARELF